MQLYLAGLNFQKKMQCLNETGTGLLTRYIYYVLVCFALSGGPFPDRRRPWAARLQVDITEYISLPDSASRD